MKFTNVKQLIIKFMGGGLINFPTRFLRWVKINGDTDDSDDGGDTPVSNIKPWLKGLCINENLPEDVQQLPDCFHNAGFAKVEQGGVLENLIITKLTDEEIENYDEEHLIESYDRIRCLFDAEKIEEYLTQNEVEIPEINNSVFIPYPMSYPAFLTEVHYYYTTILDYSSPYKDLDTNVYGMRFGKIRTTNNEIYYIKI